MNEAITLTGAIFALIAAMFFQRRDVSELKTDLVKSIDLIRSDMRRGFDDVNVRLDKMDEHIHHVETTQGNRLTALESRS